MNSIRDVTTATSTGQAAVVKRGAAPDDAGLMRAAAAPLLLLALTGAGPVCDAVWHDGPRNRDVPVRIRLPDGSGRVPVVVFSPGMGGSITAGGLWGTAWSAAGLAVIHVQHQGSGPEVYRGARDAADRRARVAAAATAEQLAARVGDVGFVVDELAQRRREGACDLSRLDLARLGIAGHSMGAWVAQAVAGQRFGGTAPYADRRFVAAIGLSPSLLSRDDPAESLGAITIPFFVITGSEDGAPRPRPDEDAASLAARRARALADRTAPYDAHGRRARNICWSSMAPTIWRWPATPPAPPPSPAWRPRAWRRQRPSGVQRCSTAGTTRRCCKGA